MASNLIFNFPTRPAGAWTWPVKMTPSFSTITKTSANGIENRVSLYPYPIWEFEFDLSYLKGNQTQQSALQNFLGFYIQVGGAGNSFLWENPWDYLVTPNGTLGSSAGFVAIGDGATTSFQLYRQLGTATDIVQNPESITMYVNNSPVAASTWTQDYGGVITFNTAPAANSLIQWGGTFYFRLRFSEDSFNELQMMLNNIWSNSSLKFRSCLLPG